MEKLEIAKRFLVKKQREANGLTAENITLATMPCATSFATIRTKPASAIWNAKLRMFAASCAPRGDRSREPVKAEITPRIFQTLSAS